MAEVLITLGIIGIVAAMTIPTLIANYKKHVTVTQLKENYSLINNALEEAASDNGGGSIGDLFGKYEDKSISAFTVETDFVNKYVKPYVNIVKDYGAGTSSLNLKNGYHMYAQDGSNKDYDVMMSYGLGLSNGAYWMFIVNNDGKAWNGMIIYVDINGFKGPNTFGKDIFWLCVAPDTTKVITFLSDYRFPRTELLNPSNPWACSKKSIGDACAALIQQDGWEIKDDYPW
ncbi:type II secretion system protein [bacterium]|nr:type II secretion system protein [bacterium]